MNAGAKRKDSSELAREAHARSEQFQGNLLPKIEVASLTLKSKLPFKALSLREVLLHRFADQSVCASSAMLSKNAVSAATLTRGCMETFARMFEFNEFLSRFFDKPDLKSLDDFLMSRLFGTRTGAEDWPEAVNILTTLGKLDRMTLVFRENYDRLSEIAHPNYAGGLGVFQRIDTENHVAYFGDPRRVELNLLMIGQALIGTQEGLHLVYNSLEWPISKMNELFENGALKHA